jgi:hypothetical protein
MQAVAAAIGQRTAGPLLLNHRGRRMTPYNVCYLVAVLAREAGIGKHLTPHGLRHSAITIGLDAGVSLRDMQDFARHADPTTRRYDRACHALNRHATYAIPTTSLAAPEPSGCEDRMRRASAAANRRRSGTLRRLLDQAIAGIHEVWRGRRNHGGTGISERCGRSITGQRILEARRVQHTMLGPGLRDESLRESYRHGRCSHSSQVVAALASSRRLNRHCPACPPVKSPCLSRR